VKVVIQHFVGVDSDRVLCWVMVQPCWSWLPVNKPLDANFHCKTSLGWGILDNSWQCNCWNTILEIL